MSDKGKASRPSPNVRALPFGGDDPLGVWVALCPTYGWDHAAVYNDPMMHVNCPFCWRFWGDELPCEIRHYDAGGSDDAASRNQVDSAAR
jgi:hypothetical protein